MLTSTLVLLIDPVADGCVGAGLADRTNVECVGIMLSWTFVDVGVSPRIQRDALQVRPVPARCVARLLDQIVETIFPLGISAGVHLEGIQRGLKISDLSLRGGHPRLLAPPHD